MDKAVDALHKAVCRMDLEQFELFKQTYSTVEALLSEFAKVEELRDPYNF